MLEIILYFSIFINYHPINSNILHIIICVSRSTTLTQIYAASIYILLFLCPVLPFTSNPLIIYGTVKFIENKSSKYP